VTQRRRKYKTTKKPTGVAGLGERRIIPVDQAPLRNQAIDAARKAITEISNLNKKLSEFERTIEPAFARWERKNLGELLARESELEEKIEALSELIEFATMQALFTGKDPYEIYTKAEREMRKSTPEESEPPPEPEDPPPSEDDAYCPEERDFRAHLRSVFGKDPDSMRKSEYSHMFRDYRAWRAKFEASTAAAARSKAADIPSRVKELYRHLVRRLHPDTGSQADPFLKSLWHDLQEAYNRRDLERLEILLAITEVGKEGDSMQSSLFHIRLVSKKMNSTLISLQKKFMRIRKSDAWKYWHAKDRRQVGAKLRKEAEERVEDAEMDLAQLEAEIAYWKSMAKPKRRAPGLNPKQKGSSKKASAIQKRPARTKPSHSHTQTSFNF
jgi:hypothetical protein